LLRHEWLSYSRRMFSEAVLDHFRNPRNAGEVANADAEVTNPVCGDVLKLSARLIDGRIAEARFLCRGCTTAIACASLLTETLRGKSVLELSAISTEEISRALGGLPQATFHAAQLAADGVAALKNSLTSKS
jgi:nitrogen fixation protein NifU and related proteins